MSILKWKHPNLFFAVPVRVVLSILKLTTTKKETQKGIFLDIRRLSSIWMKIKISNVLKMLIWFNLNLNWVGNKRMERETPRLNLCDFDDNGQQTATKPISKKLNAARDFKKTKSTKWCLNFEIRSINISSVLWMGLTKYHTFFWEKFEKCLVNSFFLRKIINWFLNDSLKASRNIFSSTPYFRMMCTKAPGSPFKVLQIVWFFKDCIDKNSPSFVGIVQVYTTKTLISLKAGPIVA